MSNFNEKDVAEIQKWGNAKAKKHWMSNYNKTLYPVPDRRDLMKMKEFMKLKYVQKRFMEGDEESDSDSDSDSSDGEKKKKKKHKKSKKAKKTKKKKKKETSSEEESDDSDSESEEEVKEKPKEKKITNTQKTTSAGIKGGKLGKPKAAAGSAKAAKEPAKQTKVDNSGILDLDFDSAPPPPEQKNQDNGDSGWGDFAFGSPAESKPAQSNDNNWGDVFDTKTQKEKQTNDLLGNLGNLYGQAQQQQQQMNPFGQFGQPSMPTGGQQNMNNFGFGSPVGTQAQAPPTQMNMNSDDPFANVLQEQQKQQLQNMQNKSQNMGSPGGQATGITPNMFFQQMMAMMGNQGASANPQQNAMMMAAMQNMMKQMSLNNQQPQQQPEVPKEEPEQPSAFSKPDPSNGAFKSLFNNAASTSKGPGGGGARFSDLGSQSSQPQNSAFDAFGSSSTQNQAQTRASEPANPFGGFGGQQTQTSNSNDMFNTQFGNSGWGGGNSGSTQQNTQPSSSNPFDMFK